MAGGNYQQFCVDSISLIDARELSGIFYSHGQIDYALNAKLRYNDQFIDNIANILEDFIKNIAENHLDEETIADIEAQINISKIRGKLKNYIDFRLNKC